MPQSGGLGEPQTTLEKQEMRGCEIIYDDANERRQVALRIPLAL